MHHDVFTDLVQKYYAEVDKGDVEGVVALFEVDAEYSRPGYAHMSGREAIRSFYVDDRIIESDWKEHGLPALFLLFEGSLYLVLDPFALDRILGHTTLSRSLMAASISLRE